MVVDRQEAAKARSRWLHFTVAAPDQYRRAQTEAMMRHIAATPALDTIIVAPHDADGRPLGPALTLSMEYIR